MTKAKNDAHQLLLGPVERATRPRQSGPGEKPDLEELESMSAQIPCTLPPSRRHKSK